MMKETKRNGGMNMMKRVWAVFTTALLLLSVMMVSTIASTTLKLQADLTDQSGGVLQGEKTVSVVLKNAGDDVLWEEPRLAVQFSEGIGLFELGGPNNPFTREMLDQDGIHFVVTIDSVDISFPIIRYATPFALKSQYVEVVKVGDLSATFNIGAVPGTIVSTQVPDELITSRMVAPASIYNDQVVTLDVSKLSGDISHLLETDIITSAQVQDGTLMNAELATGNFSAITGIGPQTISLNALSGLYVSGSVGLDSLVATADSAEWVMVHDRSNKRVYVLDTSNWDRNAGDDVSHFLDLSDVAIPTFSNQAGKVVIVSSNEQQLVLSDIADLSVRNAETLDSLDSTDFLYSNQSTSFNTGVFTITDTATFNALGSMSVAGPLALSSLTSTTNFTDVLIVKNDTVYKTPLTFSSLPDTPETFEGQEGNFLKVENGALVYESVTLPSEDLILSGVIEARGVEDSDTHVIGSVSINRGVLTGVSSINGVTFTSTGEILTPSLGDNFIGGVTINEGIITGVSTINGVGFSSDGRLTAGAEGTHQIGDLSVNGTNLSGLVGLDLGNGDLVNVGAFEFTGNLFADASGAHRVGGVTFNNGVITATASGPHQIGGVSLLDGVVTATDLLGTGVTVNTLVVEDSATIAGVSFSSNQLSNVAGISGLTELSGVVTVNNSGALTLPTGVTHQLGDVSVLEQGGLEIQSGDLRLRSGTLNVTASGPHRVGDWTFDESTLSADSATITGLSALSLSGAFTATSSDEHQLGSLSVTDGHLSGLTQLSGVVTVNAQGGLETLASTTHELGGLSIQNGEVRGLVFLGGPVTLNANGVLQAEADGPHLIGGVTVNSGILLAQKTTGTHEIGAVQISNSEVSGLTVLDFTDGIVTGLGTLNISEQLLAPGSGEHQLGDLRVSNGELSGLSSLSGTVTVNSQGIITAIADGDHRVGDIVINRGFINDISQLGGVITVSDQGAITAEEGVAHSIGGVTMNAGWITANETSGSHQIAGLTISNTTLSGVTVLDMAQGELKNVSTFNFSGVLDADGSGTHTIGEVTVNAGAIGDVTSIRFDEPSTTVIEELDTLRLSNDDEWTASGLTVSGLLSATSAGGHQIGSVVINQGAVSDVQTLNGVTVASGGWSNVPTITFGSGGRLASLFSLSMSTGGNSWSSSGALTLSGALSAESTSTHRIGSVTVNQTVIGGLSQIDVSGDTLIVNGRFSAPSAGNHQLGNLVVNEGHLSELTQVSGVVTVNANGALVANSTDSHQLGGLSISRTALGSVTTINAGSVSTTLDVIGELNLSSDTHELGGVGIASGFLVADKTNGAHTVGSVTFTNGVISDVTTINMTNGEITGLEDLSFSGAISATSDDTHQIGDVQIIEGVLSGITQINQNIALTETGVLTASASGIHQIGSVQFNAADVTHVDSITAHTNDNLLTVTGFLRANTAGAHQIGSLGINQGAITDLTSITAKPEVVTVSILSPLRANAAGKNAVGNVIFNNHDIFSVDQITAEGASLNIESSLWADASGVHNVGGVILGSSDISSVDQITASGASLNIESSLWADASGVHNVGGVILGSSDISSVDQITASGASLNIESSLWADASGVHNVGGVILGSSDISSVDQITASGTSLNIESALWADADVTHNVGGVSFDSGALSQVASLLSTDTSTAIRFLSPIDADASGDHQVGNLGINDRTLSGIEALTAHTDSRLITVTGYIRAEDVAVAHTIGGLAINDTVLSGVNELTVNDDDDDTLHLNGFLDAPDIGGIHHLGTVDFSGGQVSNVTHLNSVAISQYLTADVTPEEGAYLVYDDAGALEISASFHQISDTQNSIGLTSGDRGSLTLPYALTVQNSSDGKAIQLFGDDTDNGRAGGILAFGSELVESGPTVFLEEYENHKLLVQGASELKLKATHAGNNNGQLVLEASDTAGQISMDTVTVNMTVDGGSVMISSDTNLTGKNLGMLNLFYTDDNGLAFSDDSNAANDHILLAIHSEEDDSNAGLEYLGGLIRTSATTIGIHSTGEDYAEMMERVNHAEDLKAGDVVGVFSGKISKRITGSDHIMVISTAPVVLGGMPLGNREHYERVAFLGQVPVWITGTVQSGDYIVPSGKEDGTAIAVSPTKITRSQAREVFGQAWEEKSDEALGTVNVALLPGLSSKALVDALDAENQSLKSTNEDLKTQVELLRSDIEEIRYHILESR